MASRRSLSSIRSTFLARRLNSSFPYITHDTDYSNHQQPSSSQNRSFGSYVNNPSCDFTRAFRRTGCGLLENSLNPNRFISTSTPQEDKFGISSELVTTTTDSSTGAATEVAANLYANTPDIGAYGLQHLFDGVHSFTGLNWWASIALTTLVMRGLTIPFTINELRDASKFQLIKLEMMKKQLQVKGVDAKEVREYKMNELCNQYGLNPRDPQGRLKGLFLEGYLISQSSLLGIYYMAKFVPSFKNGGALCFTNLATPDDTYILAGLTTLALLTSILYTRQGTFSQSIRRLFVTVILPWSVILPKAIFCYLLPSELFFLCLGLALKFGSVKKALGILEVPGALLNRQRGIYSYLISLLSKIKKR